jgi:hypothetical protein
MNVVFSSRKCAQAEVDIMAYRGDVVHVYEVKCSYRFAKAKKQLLKILRIMKRPAVAYFYCGSADRLEIIATAHY